MLKARSHCAAALMAALLLLAAVAPAAATTYTIGDTTWTGDNISLDCSGGVETCVCTPAPACTVTNNFPAGSNVNEGDVDYAPIETTTETVNGVTESQTGAGDAVVTNTPGTTETVVDNGVTESQTGNNAPGSARWVSRRAGAQPRGRGGGRLAAGPARRSRKHGGAAWHSQRRAARVCVTPWLLRAGGGGHRALGPRRGGPRRLSVEGAERAALPAKGRRGLREAAYSQPTTTTPSCTPYPLHNA